MAYSIRLKKTSYGSVPLIRPSTKFTLYLTQVKKGDRESLGATLILEAERNKLSSKERSWVAGAM